MSATQTDVVDYIKNLKLSEVKALISILEEELGVEASAPMMMGAKFTTKASAQYCMKCEKLFTIHGINSWVAGA